MRRILFIWARPSFRSVVLIKSAPAVVSSQSVVSSHQSAQFLRAAAHVGRSSDCSVQWLKKRTKFIISWNHRVEKFAQKTWLLISWQCGIKKKRNLWNQNDFTVIWAFWAPFTPAFGTSKCFKCKGWDWSWTWSSR